MHEYWLGLRIRTKVHAAIIWPLFRCTMHHQWSRDHAPDNLNPNTSHGNSMRFSRLRAAFSESAGRQREIVSHGARKLLSFMSNGERFCSLFPLDACERAPGDFF